MKTPTCFLALLLLSVSPVFGQANTGILKIFSDEPVIVFVDQVQTPNYSEISLVAGTHYVKAIASASLEKEAKSRGLVVNDYNYGKSFDENYYKK